MNWLAKILKTLFRKTGELSPSCKEATRLQSQSLDQPLGLLQLIGLRIHVLLCKWCRRYAKQIGFLRSVAHQHEKHEPGSPTQSLRPETRERIKRQLREEFTKPSPK